MPPKRSILWHIDHILCYILCNGVHACQLPNESARRMRIRCQRMLGGGQIYIAHFHVRQSVFRQDMKETLAKLISFLHHVLVTASSQPSSGSRPTSGEHSLQHAAEMSNRANSSVSTDPTSMSVQRQTLDLKIIPERPYTK